MTREQEAARMILRAIRRPWDYEISPSSFDDTAVLHRKLPKNDTIRCVAGYAISIATVARLHDYGVRCFIEGQVASRVYKKLMRIK